jgi:hypothetical protein
MIILGSKKNNHHFFSASKNPLPLKATLPADASPDANFFRLILTPFLKRQKPMDLRRLFCLFAHGTKATPLLCTVNVDFLRIEYMVLAKYQHMSILELILLVNQHILILCKNLLGVDVLIIVN